MTPSDPTTMTSAILEAKRLTKKAGQATTYLLRSSTLSCGSQCTVAYPELFGEDFILRLGGMHFVMSYVGAVEVLMAGSGMEANESCLWGCNQNAHW